MTDDFSAIGRREGETDLQYHKRLIFGKLVDKTLADYDYGELAAKVYGKDYSADVARRMMYGSRYTFDLLEKERMNAIGGTDDNAALLREIDMQKAELRKERQRFFDQRREYNKIVNTDGRLEHIIETLKDAADNLGESIGTLYAEGLPTAACGDDEAVLVLGDWHYGMTTKNVYNEYNRDICKQRVAAIVERASQRIRTHRCSRLHIVVLGDLFHGAIHVGTRVASEEIVCDQIMQVSEILAQSICELSKSAGETLVYMTYGNHGRTVANKSDSIHRDNMERLIPWWLTERLSDCSNITVLPESETEFVFLDVAGHEMCASHGDLDGVRTSPLMLTALFAKQYHRNIEYIILGDKHHSESFEEVGVTARVNGSLCGTDDYANGRRLYSPPSQLLLIVNPECGVDAEYKLKATP